MISRPARCVALLLAMMAGTACTVGIGQEPHAPLIGGVYQYSATLAEGGRLVFAGTLVLQEGPGREVAGSYRLPRQCTTSDGTVLDCQGSVFGQRDDASLAFDFDNDRFHHTATLDRDGVIRGIWIFTLVDTATTQTSRLTGPFTGVPVR